MGKRLVTDEMVLAAGDTLVGVANAPEQPLYQAARFILENAAPEIQKAVLKQALDDIRLIDSVTPEDFKIGDGPFTKGDAWEAYYTGAIHTRTALTKALKRLMADTDYRCHEQSEQAESQGSEQALPTIQSGNEREAE